MKKIIYPILLSWAAVAFGQAPASPPPILPPVAPGDLVAFEQFGTAVARSAGVADLGWTQAQLEAFIAGLRGAHAKRPVALGEPGRALLAQMQRRVAEVRAAERAEANDPELVQFLRTAHVTIATQRAESGLLYRVFYPGSGPRPQPRDEVVVNFRAVMPDGKTPLPALSGENLRLRIGEMPPGVDEALQMIALGGRGIFVVPPHLSFGEGAWPDGLARGTPILLHVDVLDIIPGR